VAAFVDTLVAQRQTQTAKLDRDWTHLTAFFDFPAEHWRHLRTTNPIESSFATVKLRTRVTKGAGSKKAALAMGLQAARRRTRALAQAQRPRAGRRRTRRRQVQGRHPSQRRQHQQQPDDRREGRRLSVLTPRHPQHLTIALVCV
jgi:transposase-like protein